MLYYEVYHINITHVTRPRFNFSLVIHLVLFNSINECITLPHMISILDGRILQVPVLAEYGACVVPWQNEKMCWNYLITINMLNLIECYLIKLFPYWSHFLSLALVVIFCYKSSHQVPVAYLRKQLLLL